MNIAGKGQLWEALRDQESYLNEISAVLRIEECVSRSETVYAHVLPSAAVQLCVLALKANKAMGDPKLSLDSVTSIQ